MNRLINETELESRNRPNRCKNFLYGRGGTLNKWGEKIYYLINDLGETG